MAKMDAFVAVKKSKGLKRKDRWFDGKRWRAGLQEKQIS